jgi:hypothetical protein
MVYFSLLAIALAATGVSARDDFDPRQHLGGNSPWFSGMITLPFPVCEQRLTMNQAPR